MTPHSLARLAAAAAALPTADGAYTVAWCDGDGRTGVAYTDTLAGVGADGTGCVVVDNRTLEIVTMEDKEAA